MAIVSRIAPTPSGYLHAGNAFNFVLTWLLTRKARGSLHLRIDDLDHERARREYLEDIFRTLDWLGIDWDEGPHSVMQVEEVYSQTHRLRHYHTALDTLRAQGALFACRKSRKELAGLDGYPPAFRDQGLSLDSPDVNWRVRTPNPCPMVWNDRLAGRIQIDLYAAMPDFVVRRRDGIPAYQVASLCDDYESGVNLIVRGEDLAPSTAAQLFLARSLGWNSFIKTRFFHHPLLQAANGEKLSKSTGAPSLLAWRAASQGPERFFGWCAAALGVADGERISLPELLERFDADQLSAVRMAELAFS